MGPNDGSVTDSVGGGDRVGKLVEVGMVDCIMPLRSAGMRIDRQREIVRTLLELAAAGTTQLADAPLMVEVGDYTSPETVATEIDGLFRRRPVLVCLAGDVAEVGDYCATDSGGIPLLVVRGADGSAHGFVNICRHRGSPLVPRGRGHVTRTFHCGFHGWVYDLDGTVVGRPHSNGGFDTLDATESALVRVPTREAHGLVFVRPRGGDDVDVDALLCGMGEELDDFGFGAYHYFAAWDSEWAANWKLLADTFLETYHVPALHADTVARHFLAEPSAFAPFGPNLRFHSLQKSLLTLRDRPEREWTLLPHGTVEYLVAPNAILSFSVDHLAVYRFLPLAADRTRVECVVYTPSAPDEADALHFERTLALHQRVSGEQDFTQQEAIHAGLASGAVSEVVFGRNEPAAIHFHRALHELLGSEG
jgi:phenylpropionate dioxygenase-like ring-hydroxylating dioxygenase large terminal subunit